MYNKRLSLLILIMITVSVLVTSVSIALMYRNTIERDRSALWELVESHALVLESIFSETHDADKTLKIFSEANDNYSGIGMTGEFTLTKMENGNIVYLMARDKDVITNPKPISFRYGYLTENSRQGLPGRSGTVIAPDRRGILVLAAFRPLRQLNWFIEAKVDMKEIREPFIEASLISIAIMILLTVSGSLLFISITHPLIRKLEESEESHLLELEMGREVQLSILPEKPPEIENVSIASRYIPMEAIGGDLYDFIKISKNQAGIFIADVSGHGVPAALIASMVKVAFSAQSGNAKHPEIMLKEIRDTLPKEWVDHFLTAQYVCLDSRGLTLSLANAGHLPLLILSRNPDRILSYKPKGEIISWIGDNIFETQEITLRKGDRIVMYTDGIIEAANPKDELYGEERFKNLILNTGNLANNEFMDNLLNTIKKWREKDGYEDDITIIVTDVL